ncbi:MAG TPA: tetratricopeptide repeat protein [Gemmatimonadales bacterium]|jgi:adenylate cyclase|nr:tetratricopeptide repeat protein [Gemmatimonadales bacterium]
MVIAVLPFTNLTSDPANAYFADGTAEAIGDTLALTAKLQVSPHAAALDWTDRGGSPQEIATGLGAAAVLEGGAKRSADLVHFEVRLRAPDGASMWSTMVDRPHSEVLAAQLDVVTGVLQALKVTPAPAEATRINRPPTAGHLSYDQYLHGRIFTRELLRRSQEAALHHFGEALRLDPGFARAHAETAMCHGMIYQYWDSSAENLQRADDASVKAVALGPDLPHAHLARGLALSLATRYAEADEEFTKALALRPDLLEANYFRARSARAQGTYADAVSWFEKTWALRPLDYSTPALLASAYVSLDRRDDALATRKKSVELVERRLVRHPDDSRALYLGAACLATLGDGTKARSWAKRALAMDPDDSAVLYNVACVYALLGLDDSAIDCLEQAIQHGFRHWDWIEHDSDFDTVRSHERFKALRV